MSYSSVFHISLTGHRPNKLDGYNLDTRFYKQMRQHLMQIICYYLDRYDQVVCHSGMALGADTVWSEAIANMRFRFGSRVRFVAHVPCRNQESRWPEQSQRHYHKVLSHSDDVVIYSDHYTPSCMQDRNIGMVDAADLLLAIWDGTPGGTGNCVRAAKERNVQIHQIQPSTFKG